MLSTCTCQPDIHIRWMIRRDMPEVFGIEEANFDDPWTEDDFIRELRQRNVIALVAEHNERIAGFIVYELHKHRIEVRDIAVHASLHGKGVGRALIDKLKGKLSTARRRAIVADVRETNLDAQKFFRAMGFEASEVVKERFCNGEDAYRFRYQHIAKAESPHA